MFSLFILKEEINMGINLDELILDRVRHMTFSDLLDGSIIGRLTSLEDPSLNTASEGEDVTDAIGSVITTLYRAKTAEFSANNSLFSLDLAAMQYGTTKQVADSVNKIIMPAGETLTVDSNGKITLSHKPVGDLKYIYKLESGSLSKKINVGVAVSNEEFSINDKVITVPTGMTGYFYVEYEYETESGVKVSNNTNNFPTSVGVRIFVIFRDKCNDAIKYAGVIVAKKGKLDPSSVEHALTSTGKHPFTVKFTKDFCDENADLFSVHVAE